MTTPEALRSRAKLLGARCDLCPLAKNGIPVPPLPAPKKVRLAVIGEGPGQYEERLGSPFLGRSGQLLDTLLTANKIKRATEVYVTNASLCRGETDKEKEIANRCCAPRLLYELGHLPKATVLAPLGKLALESVLGVTEIFLSRGFVWTAPEVDYSIVAKRANKPGAKQKQHELERDTLVGRAKLAGRPVLPTLHPAYVLRSEVWLPILRADFRRIRRALDGEIVLVNRGPHEVTTKIEKLKSLGSSISLDVETTKTGSPLTAKLLCVGVSDGKETFVVWPWHRKLAKGMGDFLRSRAEVVGHNLMTFDRVVLETHGVK